MGLRPPSLAVLICAAAAGCGGDSSDNPTAPSSTTNVQIGGRVIDERTRQGVAGVGLHWGGVGIPASLTTVTDATGSYHAQLPEAASYSVSADPMIPMSVVRPIGTLDIVNFYVNTGGCPTQYGRVVDAVSRRAVAGAVVSWAGATSTSDTAGNYRLTLECRPGGYGSGPTTLGVSHASYQTYAAPARNAETLGASAWEARLDIALTPR